VAEVCVLGLSLAEMEGDLTGDAARVAALQAREARSNQHKKSATQEERLVVPLIVSKALPCGGTAGSIGGGGEAGGEQPTPRGRAGGGARGGAAAVRGAEED
jgi:hypothetical protein